jgi:hypothetical protein
MNWLLLLALRLLLALHFLDLFIGHSNDSLQGLLLVLLWLVLLNLKSVGE